MAVAKLLLLIIGAIAQTCGTTPPNVRPPTEQLREQHGGERMLPMFTALTRTVILTWTFLEALIICALSGYYPPTLARPLLHTLLPRSISAPQSLTTLTLAFSAGTLLAVFGVLLRVHCFRILGPHFTFELSIRPTHALVTRGVYGVVRHPSYTGALALAVGWLLCVLDRRGWVVSVLAAFVCANGSRSEYASDAVVTNVLGCAWAMALGIMFVGLNGRMDREDAILEENFGEEWRAWAKKVPWRLVPGVY